MIGETGEDVSTKTELLDKGTVVLQTVQLSVCVPTVDPVLAEGGKVTIGQQYLVK